ncbi:MAG TPA: DUF2235 domain-containing protein [Candidatus Acidoferrum sp.]|nr:DUF2235 domain-containing protein [Candidatus Acidoferrum sp.]
MTARLVLCFDGTWNKPDVSRAPDEQVETNVRRFHEAVLATAPGGVRQVKWYSPGVGTRWDERLRGGAFGYGIDEIIRSGYDFLATNYVEGDELFILGFSRGAYAARSLVGMLRKSGLVTDLDRVPEAYALYRDVDDTPDSDAAKSFRAANARTVGVKFLGVWDTVGALGIPASLLDRFRIPGLESFDRRKYQFHDTGLSGIVENAYHAVAIDEHREEFKPTLWTAPFHDHQTVEQRWFVGAHCDVGGGYAERELSDLGLAWMMEKAASCGLALAPARRPQPKPDWARGTLHDSFKEFLGGVGKLLENPYFRPLTLGDGDRQVMDDSVRLRFTGDPFYRPKNQGFPPRF